MSEDSPGYADQWQAGYRARVTGHSRGKHWSDGELSGWDTAQHDLKFGPDLTLEPDDDYSIGEDRRLTALNIAAKWADHAANNLAGMENATLRIERYLRTGSFDAEAKP